MKAFTLFLLAATAMAAPATKADCAKAPAPAASAPAGRGGAGAGAGAAAGGAASCAQTRANLAKGIQDNLNIQAQELAGVQALQKQIGTPDFKTTQAQVLKIQQNGINVRANNQKLAQQINSPALTGLNTVQGAQVTEMTQVKGLTGTAADTATLATLVQEVQGGTKQNQMNLAAAKSTTC